MNVLMTGEQMMSRFQLEIRDPIFSKRVLEDLYRYYPKLLSSLDTRARLLQSVKQFLESRKGEKFSLYSYGEYLWLIFFIKEYPDVYNDKNEYQLKVQDTKSVVEASRVENSSFLLSDLICEISIALNYLDQKSGFK